MIALHHNAAQGSWKFRQYEIGSKRFWEGVRGNPFPQKGFPAKSPLTASPALLASNRSFLISDFPMMIISTLIAILFHEAGHLCAALLLHIPVKGLRLSAVGLRLQVGGRIMAFWEEFLLSAAGPMAGFFLSLALFPLWRVSAFFFDVSRISFLLGALNLLPVMSFDGGRMLSAVLSRLLPYGLARCLMRSLSFVTLFLLWSTAVYFLLRTADGLSLLSFSMTLFWHFFCWDEMV